MRPVELESRYLSRSVDPTIGSAGQHDGPSAPPYFAECTLEFSLNRPRLCLALASSKRAPIVGQDQFVMCHLHGASGAASYSSTSSRMTISAESPSRGPKRVPRVQPPAR